MERMFGHYNSLLTQAGCMVSGGSIIDASIIRASSSTRNEAGERDPEMHSTQKGGDWFFGMSATRSHTIAVP
jgi:IS5 family transposase